MRYTVGMATYADPSELRKIADMCDALNKAAVGDVSIQGDMTVVDVNGEPFGVVYLDDDNGGYVFRASDA